MWYVSAVPLEWAINPNFLLSADEQLEILPFHNLARQFTGKRMRYGNHFL